MSLKRIILTRHAQSQEDVNPNLKGELEDHQISITDTGRSQASELVGKIKRCIDGLQSVRVYSSTSNRVLQTAFFVLSGIGLDKANVIIEPRIRGLDWGNTTPDNVSEIERQRYEAGVLYYQFPDGDHSPTFVRKIGEFIEELLTLGKLPDFSEAVIILTHGFTMRIIVKFLLKMSDADFQWIKNPSNCYVANCKIDDFGNVSIDKPLPCREPV